MKKNLALVTGATSGIGFHAAKLLAQDGWGQVMVTGRSQPLVGEIVSQLNADTGTQNVTGIALDLNSFASVKEALAELVQRGVSIDFLVLNAGLIPGKNRVVTGENIESAQAPLIGHHQLTLGLLSAGLLAPDARIVIAGSEAARGDVPLFRCTDLRTFSENEFGGDRVAGAEALLRGFPKRKYSANTTYADAKIFVAWWVAALAPKLPKTMGIYAISPGSTPDTRGLRSAGFMLRHVMVPILRLLPGMTQSPEESAKRYLAAINYGVEDSGKFFASPSRKMTGPVEVMRHEHFHDHANQDALWRAVVNVSGVGASSSVSRRNPATMWDMTAFGFSHISVMEPGRLAFLSGQIATTLGSEGVPEDLASQARLATANLAAALKELNATAQDIVMLRVYVVNAKSEDFQQAVAPLRQLVGDAMPSITTIGVQALFMPEIKVEIEMIVRIP